MKRHLDRITRGVFTAGLSAFILHQAIAANTETSAIAYIQRLSAADQRAGIETQWDAYATGKFAGWVKDICGNATTAPAIATGIAIAALDDRRRAHRKQLGTVSPDTRSRLNRIAQSTGQTADQFLKTIEDTLL